MSQVSRNEILRVLDPMKKHNFFPGNGFNVGNSKEHEQAKFDVAWEHAKMHPGIKCVLLEPIFKDGSRGDVMCTVCEKIIEIVDTEKEDSLIRKTRDYPLPIEIIKVKEEKD